MDFNSLLAALHDSTEVFTIQDIVLTITLSFALSLIIGWIYKITHRGVSYSQSYVQTLVMMAMVVGIVMLIIGSNIARAFTLVGALSIVRCNAVRPRDVGYIFSMAIGMCKLTCWRITLVIAALIWVMDRYDFFSKEAAVQLLKIRLPSDMTYRGLFDETFRRYVDRYDLVAMETVLAGTLTELVYSVELKRNAEVEAFLRELGELNQNNKVVLVTGQQEADL